MNDCKVAISKLLEASLEHLKSNQHFEAEKCIRQILALDNKCGQAWHQLARIAEHFGNLDQALHLNHNAFLLELNNSEYIAYQGRIFLMAQKIDAAIEWLKKSIEINPEYLDAHYYLAIAYQFIKDHEKAIIALQAVVKINENHAAANQMLAQLLIENNQWENGVDFYKKNINPELLGLVFESSLVGVKAWAMSRRLEVMEFGDKEEIVVSQPKSFGQYFQTEVGTVYGNKLYAAELENVSAIAKGETLLTDDQLSLNDAAVDYQYGSLVDLRFSEYIKYRNNEKLLIDLLSLIHI